MRTYIIRRVLVLIPVFIGILFLLYLLAELSPGTIVDSMMDPNMTPEAREHLVRQFGLDQPFIVRFFNWSRQALTGNLGFSGTYYRPVTEVIGNFIGNTFTLAISSLIFAMALGIPIGIISATKQYSAVDNIFTIFSLIGISIPSFFFGLLLLKFFAIDNQIFPLLGNASPMMGNATRWEIIVDRAHHLVLPTIVLGLGSMASFMRYTRSSMLEVIKMDYIRTARAKGLKEKVVIYRHAFRNAILPVITLIGFQIPALLSGAVVTETIFGLAGVGKISVEAIMKRDDPLFMGINAMLAFVTLFSALIADILYAMADPRIKLD